MGAVAADLQSLQSSAFEAFPQPALLFTGDGRLAAAKEPAELLFGLALGPVVRGSVAVLGEAAGLLARSALARGHARARDVEIVVGGLAVCRADLAASVMRDGGVLLALSPRDPFGRAEAADAGSLGGLGRALAHEIKNPLAGIRGAAQLLKDGARAEDAALADLIVEETERIRRLADRMEDLAQEGPARREAVNIHKVLDRVGALLASTVGEGLSLRQDYDPSLPDALGDEDQLVQVFLNLVKNAAEAVRDRAGVGGEILVSTAYRHQPRPGPGEPASRPATPLEVRVRDNGPGVPPALRDRLFQPFASGKPGGTGLGLTLTARLVAVHGGSIEVESEPGRTVFRVLLPVAIGAEAKP
jgi:two-component system nitrogen regulation sensor histidine kinase GlnL